MSNLDYKNLSKITVKSQAELDMIPDDFKGRIYIECTACVVVSKRYYYRVEARGNSSVEARGNSSVVARENSSVVARGNSSVEANANVQVVDRQIHGKIEISGNARIVYMPKNIKDFMNFYGIKHTKTKATFYKAVRKIGGEYVSDHDESFVYEIGKTKKENCNTDVTQNCASGIHISHLDWALRYGENWKNLAIIEVETAISDIVLPDNSDGKVRTSKVKVIREVPLSECGVYGKILAKRLVKS